jgi:hypothetical protein
MRNTIDTDQNNDMRRAIGEGLRTRLRAEPELPQGLEAKIDELRRLEGPRLLVPEVEHQLENKPSSVIGGQNRPPFIWSWLLRFIGLWRLRK